MGLDKNRLVLIENPTQGTGYLIGPRLVLTAAHVVDPGVTPEVSLIRSKAAFAATVIWRRHDDSVDAALLQIVDADWPKDVTQTPVRWGRLATLRPGAAWKALAFPASYRDAESRLDVAQLSGQLNPGDKMLSRRYLLRLDGGSPAVAGRSPWEGASGAALFIGDLLCGVVTVDPAEWGHNRLEAVLASLLFEDGEFREALGVQPVLEVVEFQPIASAPRTRPLRSIADLLHPDAALVPFHGYAKDDTLPDFLRWCNDDDRYGVGLLFGPGGRGKTRFAAELSSRLRSLGWTVIDLRRPEFIASSEIYSVIGDATTPMLIIVDYAETRTEQVKILLQAAGEPESLRILLLARSAGEWWDDLRSQVAGLIIAESLPALATTPEEWLDEYRTALHHMAYGLTRLPRYADTDWETVAQSVAKPTHMLSDGSPLTVHMAALTNLLNSATSIGDTENRPLEEQVIAHERRYWEESAKAAGLLSGQGAFGPLPPAVLKLLVATTVVTRPPSKSYARWLLKYVPGLIGEPYELTRISAADWLHMLYPPGDNSYWGTLQPDRVGEYHLGLCMRDEPEFLQRLTPALDSKGIEHVLTVLGRVAVHSSLRELAIDHLRKLFTLDPPRIATTAVAVATQIEHPDYLLKPLDAFVHSSDTTPETIAAIMYALPLSTHTLHEFAVSVSGRYMEVLKCKLDLSVNAKKVSRLQVWSNVSAYQDLVRSLNVHSLRLASLGYEMKALEHTDLAIKICRYLPTNASTLLTLGTILINHANQLENVGRLQDAIKIGEKAIAVHRKILTRKPAEALPQLGAALNNQSARLDEIGKEKKALALVNESIKIHRELVGITEAFEPELAGVLITQFVRLHQRGMDNAALAAILESEAIFRKLAERQPDGYLASLADTLHNKAIGLEGLKRFDEALATIDESISIHNSILDRHPDYYTAGCAKGLMQKAQILFTAGRRDEAISTIEACVDSYQALIERYPQETVADFMAALTNAGYMLKDLGLYEDSRWCAEEALGVYINVARDNYSAAGVIIRLQELILFHHERNPGGGRTWVEKNRKGITFHYNPGESQPFG
jgi:tetratricopeptide (TPR) repeat protein